MSVIDAYDGGRGRLVLKVGGQIPLKKMTGPDVDRGELQRYLGSIGLCPPMLVRHGLLLWEAVDSSTLRLRDGDDPLAVTVDVEIGEDGCPAEIRAERPRALRHAGRRPTASLCTTART